MSVEEEREIVNAERRSNERAAASARRQGKPDLAAAFVALNRRMVEEAR